MRQELPPHVQRTLLAHEAAGTTDAPAYQEAMLVFSRRHVCRVAPWPEYVDRAFARIGQQVYGTMNGPSEFHVVGRLKPWDIRDRLGELTPAQAEVVRDGIPGPEWVLFEQSSHLSHAEEPAPYLAALDDFFGRVERAEDAAR